MVFNLVPRFLQATLRQYGFMITGLKEVEESLRSKGIPLHLMMGDPTHNIPSFIKEQNAVILVSDFSPLRVYVEGSLNYDDTLFLIIDTLDVSFVCHESRNYIHAYIILYYNIFHVDWRLFIYIAEKDGCILLLPPLIRLQLPHHHHHHHHHHLVIWCRFQY